jgi:hypothetical protein
MQKNIIKQRDVFINSINAASNEISNLKIKIANDFKNGDSKGSLENIDKYLELNQKLNFAKIYISYINHFIDQYNFLNNYSKNLAEVLISNRDAIIKDSYVVVPKK